MITNQALMILHQKLNFIGSVNRQYDASFAKSGAKIGDTLRVRLPNEYTVRSGATLSAQDTTETSVALPVTNQKGVDVNFSSEELTMDIDSFSERILEPAMSVLAANIEHDMMDSVYKEVYNFVDNAGSAMTFAKALEAGKRLTDSLAPYDARCLNLDTQSNIDMVDALKGLFNAQDKLSSNYKQGRLAGPFAGFDGIYENTLWPTHTSGTDDGTGDHLVDGASQVGSAITTGSEGSGTLTAGDIVTITGVNRVHPETKADTGELQQFVVTSDYSASATTLNISPAIVVSGGAQNVTASPANDAPINKLGGGASSVYSCSMAYHKDAFAFATADLVMPKGVDMAARKQLDGVSMRIVRDYDINNDKFPCRMDVLYGYKAIRPQLACRIGNN
jgi:hypothetical protein|tara:strand:+ start:1038 stop:2210 length:1173 start_codon:yes stop_codon:yes gene_type:complete